MRMYYYIFYIFLFISGVTMIHSNKSSKKNIDSNSDKTKNLNTNKILVNKYYYLEENYEPDNLETISKQYALEGMKLVREAKENSLFIFGFYGIMSSVKNGGHLL